MKKILITLALLVAMTVTGFSQISLFKPVPKDLFKTLNLKVSKAGIVNTKILWRFDAQVIGNELTYNKVTKQLDSAPLSGVGPGFGIRHYYQAPDGTAATDWGVSLAVLVGTDLEHITPASIKPALTVNAFNFVNVGVDLINFKTIGYIIGAQVNF
jgi:hypothetical protein